MLTYKFIQQEHEDFGTPGWLLSDAPSTYVPVTGAGVAHDILEHDPNDSGSIEEELMALGSALFLRGEGGYWTRSLSRVSPGRHVGSDIGNDLAIKYEGVFNGIASPGRTYKLSDKVEVWIQEAVESAREEILSHCAYESSVSLRMVKDYLRKVPGWVRRGYRRAARKYHHTNPWALSNMFELIEKKSDSFLSTSEEGDFLFVQLDIKNHDCRIWSQSWWDTPSPLEDNHDSISA